MNASDSRVKNQVPEIMRWLPPDWDLFCGNRALKRQLKKLLLRIRTEYRNTGKVTDVSRLCFLITGDSRSGKTSLIKHFVRCITCVQLNEETLNPCDGTCSTCSMRPEQYGMEGLHSTCVFGPNMLEVHFMVVDCTKIYSPDQLRSQLIGTCDWTDGLRVFYFDEVHRLVQRNMDEMLLKEIEEKNFMWIFSTAKPQNLEDMLLNRLLKLKTDLPESEELEDWLIGRCNDWGIAWESEAIMRVVEKCNRVPGTALHALALAAVEPDPGLTLDLVENDWQVKLDE